MLKIINLLQKREKTISPTPTTLFLIAFTKTNQNIMFIIIVNIFLTVLITQVSLATVAVAKGGGIFHSIYIQVYSLKLHQISSDIKTRFLLFLYIYIKQVIIKVFSQVCKSGQNKTLKETTHTRKLTSKLNCIIQRGR